MAIPPTPPKQVVKFPPLHAAQQALVQCPARFRVACCGRRWGKGIASALEEIAIALRGGQVWHISPDFPQSQEHWGVVRRLVRQIPGVIVRESESKIITPAEGYVQIRTANQTLVGSGLDHITVDECAKIHELQTIWQESLRPTLADRKGRALFTSTPQGLDFFHDLYGYGLDPAMPEWVSFNFPTSTNPFIDPAEIEAARLSLPDRAFRQEWLAEFVVDGAGVFRFVREVSLLDAQTTPKAGQRIVFGLDWGRSNDFTACSGIDIDTRRQVFMDRFTDIGWQLQRARLKMLYDRWKPTAIYAEENSIGGPNIEALQAEGLPVYPFTTTNASKAEIINGLALSIEKQAAGQDGGVLLLDDPVQRNELLAYTFERTPSGLYRYTAPVGKHDDTVIALALAWYGVTNRRLAFVRTAPTALVEYRG